MTKFEEMLEKRAPQNPYISKVELRRIINQLLSEFPKKHCIFVADRARTGLYQAGEVDRWLLNNFGYQDNEQTEFFL